MSIFALPPTQEDVKVFGKQYQHIIAIRILPKMIHIVLEYRLAKILKFQDQVEDIIFLKDDVLKLIILSKSNCFVYQFVDIDRDSKKRKLIDKAPFLIIEMNDPVNVIRQDIVSLFNLHDQIYHVTPNGDVISTFSTNSKFQVKIDHLLCLVSCNPLNSKVLSSIYPNYSIGNQRLVIGGTKNGELFIFPINPSTNTEIQLIHKIGEPIHHIVVLESSIVILGEKGQLLTISMEGEMIFPREHHFWTPCKRILHVANHLVFLTVDGQVLISQNNPNFEFYRFPISDDVDEVFEGHQVEICVFHRQTGSLQKITIHKSFPSDTLWCPKTEEFIQTKIKHTIQSIDNITQDYIRECDLGKSLTEDLINFNQITQIEMELNPTTFVCQVVSKMIDPSYFHLILENKTNKCLRGWNAMVLLKNENCHFITTLGLPTMNNGTKL
jgi:hypothetical protein